ncbi:MAG TPA: hypothetical protein VER76_10550 [Pyrinomonadaceae bacterium]|nr:hypothetical protein [Pyrinomonadaceae bacterium]
MVEKTRANDINAGTLNRCSGGLKSCTAGGRNFNSQASVSPAFDHTAEEFDEGVKVFAVPLLPLDDTQQYSVDVIELLRILRDDPAQLVEIFFSLLLSRR